MAKYGHHYEIEWLEGFHFRMAANCGDISLSVQRAHIVLFRSSIRM